MRKFFQRVLPLGAVMTMMALSGVCHGQTPEGYYLRNDSLVRENARFTVDSLLKAEDEVTRVPYVEATVKAFERYWSKAKVNYDWKALGKSVDRVDQINAGIAQCDSLQSELGKELAKGQLLIEDTDSVRVSETEVMAYLVRRIEELRQTSETLTQQIEASEQTISQRKDSVEQRSDRLEADAASGSDLEQAYISEDILIDLINRVAPLVATDIVSVQVGDIDRAQEFYDRYIDIIGTISPQKYTIIVEGMGKMAPFRPLVDALNRSLIAMAGRFDADQNQTVAQEIEALVNTGKSPSGAETLNTTLLSATQKAKCQDIVSALKEQERSFRNLTYLLEYILKQNPTGITAGGAGSYDVTTDIAKVVNIVNPSQSRYNPLYTNFNRILDALESELKGVDLTVEGLTEYLQQKKGQL